MYRYEMHLPWGKAEEAVEMGRDAGWGGTGYISLILGMAILILLTWPDLIFWVQSLLYPDLSDPSLSLPSLQLA